MTNIRPYIEAEENKQAKERIEELFKSKSILRLLNDLRIVCDDYYEREPSYKVDMKDTFGENLDRIRNEFLDQNNKLSPCEMALIYQYTEFIKTKC